MAVLHGTLSDGVIVALHHQLYWRVRGDWDLGHRALNCLVQLASLNGAVLINRQVRIKYLSQYLECLFSLLSRWVMTSVLCMLWNGVDWVSY